MLQSTIYTLDTLLCTFWRDGGGGVVQIIYVRETQISGTCIILHEKKRTVLSKNVTNSMLEPRKINFEKRQTMKNNQKNQENK